MNKICIQKIARFIIRFFSSKTLTADIKKTAQDQKTKLKLDSINAMDLKNVHLKQLPPLPPKPENFNNELKKRVASRAPLKSHELEELNKKNSLEKVEKLKKDLQIEEHKDGILGDIERFNKKNLKKVAQAVVKKVSNSLFDELLIKFKNTNIDDENEDSDSDNEEE